VTKIQRQEFVAPRQGRSVDLADAKKDEALQKALAELGADASLLDRADRDGDGKLDAAEAFRAADGFDDDGDASTLRAADASGNPTRARKALEALGCLWAAPAAPVATPSLDAARAPKASALPTLEQLDAAAAPFGPGARERLTAWRDLLIDLQGRSPQEQVNRVDAFFREQVAYVSDQENFGQADRWQAPLELVGRGSGDCEDFALAKYASLRLLGWSADSLQLGYVKLPTRESHMVLVTDASDPERATVLDNMCDFPSKASLRGDLTPVLLANERGVHLPDRGALRPAAMELPLSRVPQFERGFALLEGLLPNG
jgi:predicted transglutaminase-like cysteine proteinase